MRVLVTGGSGYIGSHTVLELLQKGYDVTVVDNLSNSSTESITRVEALTGKKVELHTFDLCDYPKVAVFFQKHRFDAVIHFAGLKAVGESVAKPLLYYKNNLLSTLNLCEAMEEFGPKRFVFSSSATVYGNPDIVPVDETAPFRPASPYAQNKIMNEQILQDLVTAHTGWRVTLLRYFNPIGAHQSGRIGEDPNGIPNNLLPNVAQVAVGKRTELQVFGNDYDTPDGTCIRDYIHVVDLAKGHIAALEHEPKANTCEIYNLGTGIGYSVFEVVQAFEAASGKRIPYKVVGRRSGDVDEYYADAQKAGASLGWYAEKTLEDACLDTWRWQSQNPNGYATVTVKDLHNVHNAKERN